LTSVDGVNHLGMIPDISNARPPQAARYNRHMARGWESKSVEEQQAEARSTPAKAKTPLTPAQVAAQRLKQGLMLSRKHVLQEIEASQNPRRLQMLQKALADLDAQLNRLG